MANEVSIFEGATNLPAYFNDLFGEESNVQTSVSIPSVSIRGKVFRIILDGNEKIITRVNPDTNEEEPASTFDVVVLDQSKFGSRVYYSKAYSGGDEPVAPDCFSLNGETPDMQSPNPQAKSCATCPHAVKGSKVSPSGALTTACQLQRRLVVVPAKSLKFPALLLRLAPTSAYDPDTKGAESGWFAWTQYIQFLARHGVKHTAQVVTRMRFDPAAEYPKLLFRPIRFLNEEEARIIAPRLKSEEVLSLITPSTTPRAQSSSAAPAAGAFFPEEEESKPVKAEQPKAVDDPVAEVLAAALDDEEVSAPALDPKPVPLPRRTTKPKVEVTTEAKPVEAALDAVLNDWDSE